MEVFPDRSKARVKLPKDAFKKEKELLDKMIEVMGTDVHPRDFLALNGDPSEFGWQRVLQFAAYEKFNYFLPFLKESLPDSVFENLVKEDALNDFIYVYCTMLSMILKADAS